MNRHATRENALKILFQLDINDKHPEEAIEEQFESLEVDTYLKSLVEGVANYKNTIDEKIAEHMEKWSIDRIASVEKTILRIAVFEISYREDIPVNVAINEAVELANSYGDEKSGKFVNGVLSKIIA
ncbi:transcription antitermination factor NusB [Lentibacillus amyloliquefaciens]|uniref:Transcription antitermination protein NusB n=1 Tax=Lentibacillus amyloliquefaciens TaxID=1472767 RepID=A0A0U3NMQ0_9BACI|nr:transcription antitermination factor NusB [Lentibacillus amyloliquefaciens]ALX48043.1 N utilization substance protein B [Lentibacillus amyloliquefaciens]